MGVHHLSDIRLIVVQTLQVFQDRIALHLCAVLVVELLDTPHS